MLIERLALYICEYQVLFAANQQNGSKYAVTHPRTHLECIPHTKRCLADEPLCGVDGANYPHMPIGI